MKKIQMKTNRWTATVIAAAAAACFLCAAGSQAAMIHYYNFDEGAGTNVFDQVITNPQHGTFGAGKNPTNDWVDSPLIGGGTALQFNGVRGDGILDDPQVHPTRLDREPQGPKNDVVRFGSDASFALTSTGTIMFWMRQDPGPDGDGSAYGEAGAINNPDNSNWLVVHGSDPFSYLLHNQPNAAYHGRIELNGGPNIAAPSPLPVGTWVHFVVGWNSGENSVRLWVDGDLVGNSADAWSGLNDQGGPFVLGGHDSHTGTGRGFLGAIDELKIFDELLDNAAVQAEMASIPLPGPGFETVTVGPTTFLQFDSEVGRDYVLQVSNSTSVVFVDAGVSIVGDGGTQRLYDPNGFDNTAQYQILGE